MNLSGPGGTGPHALSLHVARLARPSFDFDAPLRLDLANDFGNNGDGGFENASSTDVHCRSPRPAPGGLCAPTRSTPSRAFQDCCPYGRTSVPSTSASPSSRR